MILQGFMQLVLTHSRKKMVNTMASIEEPVVIGKGVEFDLIVIHEEYLENALGINWIEMGIINHIKT